MLKDKKRFCDVCGEEIPNGEKYSVSIVPRDKAQEAWSMFAESGELAPAMTVEADGSLRFDVCMDCRITMPMKGMETVH